MQIDGISALVLVLIASFAIDRITSGLIFLFGFFRFLPDPQTVEEGPARVRAQRRQKLVYFGLAGMLGIALIAWYGGVMLFRALGFGGVPGWLDAIVTGLILVAGADRLAGILKMTGVPGSGAASEARPIQITGKLVLDRGDTEKTAP